MLSIAVTIGVIIGSVTCIYGTGVNVNGENVTFTDKTGYPYVDQNNRTQVPLRVTMEAAGAVVTWDQNEKIATVEKRGNTVQIPVGADYIIVDGVKTSNDTAAVIKDGRVYLPIRAVLKALDFSVEWDEKEQVVYAASFLDYVQNQGSVLEEQYQNAKTAKDLINYYRSKREYERDQELAQELIEQEIIDELTSTELTFTIKNE